MEIYSFDFLFCFYISFAKKGPNFVGLCKLEPSLTLISNNINK